MFFLEYFIRKLHLTIDYVELSADSRLSIKPLQSLQVARDHYFEDRSRFAHKLETQRRQFLDYHFRHKTWKFQSYDALEKGKILVYEPDSTLIEGASLPASEGFFDDYDCPPIDTWFDFIYKDVTTFETDVLISWIPEKYIGLAQRGIEVNSNECIYWLDKSSAPFAAMLREHGILK